MIVNEIHMARQDTIVTSAQLKNLIAQPISLLDCPPSSVLIPHRAAFSVKFINSPYSIMATNIVIWLNEIILGTLDERIFTGAESSGALINIKDVNYAKVSKVLDQNIWLKNLGSKNLSGGNGFFKSIIWYSVFTINQSI